MDDLKISELRYRRLFETARDGILLLDSDHGRITDANPYMTELLGYSHEELLGKELWQIGLLQDKSASQRAFQQLKREGYIRYEDLPLENQRGEKREVEFVSNLYPENGHTVIQCNVRDITERKRVEAALVAAADKHGRQSAELAVLEERSRLAREIHDTLAQGFTGISTQLEAAEAALANSPDPTAPDSLAACQSQLTKIKIRIGKARDLARESLVEARRSVADLRAPTSETIPLAEALEGFLSQKALGRDSNCGFQLEGAAKSLPVSTELYLMRIGQEAIVNAMEHAQAQQINVTLTFESGLVCLRVYDDGLGFDPQRIAPGRFGIIGMRERAEKAHGQLSILSQAGEGTKITLTVPLHHEPGG